MQEEARALFADHFDTNGKSAAGIMAEAESIADGDELGLPSEIVDRIVSQLIELPVVPRIVSIPTFIPEIMAVNERSSERAVRALRFAVRLAHAFNRVQGSVVNVELVAGTASKTVRTVPVIGFGDSSLKTLEVVPLEPDQALDRLLKRLQPVVELARSLHVPLALELEPGPFYALGDLRDLVWLTKRLNSMKASDGYQWLGFNLDIAHWACLAGITVEDLAARKDIMRRIVHAHISDHCVGHVADGNLCDFNPLSTFAPWVRLLRELHEGQQLEPGTPPLRYSGYVGYEIEASSDIDGLRRGWAAARTLVASGVLGLSGGQRS